MFVVRILLLCLLYMTLSMLMILKKINQQNVGFHFLLLASPSPINGGMVEVGTG